MAGFRANVQHYRFAHSDFLTVPGITPFWTLIQNDTETLTLQGHVKAYNFLGQGPVDDLPFDQDSHNFMGGVTKTWNFPREEVLLIGGYQLDYNESDGANFDYIGNRFDLGLRWFTPVRGSKVQANASYIRRDYSNAHSLFGVPRNDNQLIVGTSLIHTVDEQMDLIATYNYIRNQSNVPINDYTRHTVDVGVVFYAPGGRLDRNDRTVYGRFHGRDR